MRRTLVLALAALALLGVVTPDACAQAPAAAPGAPAPTFKITGFIDELITYSQNTSNFDFDLHRNDTLFYGRTRGRLDIIGEYGKARAVLGLETDMVYGQTGSNDSTIVNAGAAATSSVAVMPGTDGGFDLNTDTRAILEVKWLYVEFEVPLIPVPTVARLGAQPFGSAANYKLAVYATGDFPGVNIVSDLTPNVKIVATYVAVEEALSGRQGLTGKNSPPAATFFGISPTQMRGDDWAVIVAPEVTPIKGLDIKPMYSYFSASGVTSSQARSPRGGINATNWFQNSCGATDPGCTGNDASGTWRKGLNEDRHTVGIDAWYRMGPFSLDPTVLYQFGNRSLVAPTLASGLLPAQLLDSGVVPGRKYTSNIDAFLVDLRGGYQLGPLLLEWQGMFTTGNRARNNTLGTVRYFQPLNTDTSYLADWGSQLTALGVDYLDAMLEGGGQVAYPGSTIGWDKYGRRQIGARATYAWTPALSMYGGANGHWTQYMVQKNAIPLASAGIVPLFTGQQANNKSNYVGAELFAGITWRFAPGIAWDNAGGYMFTGPALDAVTNPQTGSRDAKDAYILTSRIRFSF